MNKTSIFNLQSLFNISTLTSIIVVIIAVTASYIRLYFGVDFTDEAYYTALAYRYVLGDVPFVNELSVIPFGIMIAPFVKLYVWIVGNTDGIILFARHLYFILTLFLASTIFLVVRKYFSWYLSLLIASIAIAFEPYMIPSLSYNSMGVIFFTAGCFLGICIFLYPQKKICLFFAGICHGLSVFAYPNLLIPVLVYFLGLSFINYKNIKKIFYYILGGLIPASLLLSLIIHAGIDNFLFALNYAKKIISYIYNDRTLIGNARTIFKSLLWQDYPHYLLMYLIISSLLITSLIFRKNKQLLKILSFTIFLIPAFGLKANFIEAYSGLSSRFYMFYFSYGFIYLIFLHFISKSKFLNNQHNENNDTLIFYLIWFSCFFAGITMAFASGNSYRNLGVGMLGCGIITLIYGVSFLDSNNDHNQTIKNNNIHQTLFISLAVLLCLFFQYSGFSKNQLVYRDANIPQLTKKTDFGPFKGIYTTPEKNQYFEQIYQDIKSLEFNDWKILVYQNNLPAIYLLTSLKPATRVTFSVPNYAEISKEKEYICKNKAQRIIAVKVNQVLNWVLEGVTDDLVNDPINKLIQQSEITKIIDRDNYSIYVVEKLQC